MDFSAYFRWTAALAASPRSDATFQERMRGLDPGAAMIMLLAFTALKRDPALPQDQRRIIDEIIAFNDWAFDRRMQTDDEE